MENLLELIAQSIVAKPEAVKVTKETDETRLILKLEVDPEDIKIVIGKGGKTIRAIRSLLRLRAIKEKVQVDLQLVEQ